MKGLLAALAAMSLGTAAFGGLYEYKTTNPAADGIDVSTAGGTVSSLDTTFNTSTKAFTWTVTFSDGVAKNTNGFWLVVSGGPNPKSTGGEYAIMYFDASSLSSPNVSIYEYNGVNGDNSFQTPAVELISTKTSGQSQISGVSASQSGASRTFAFNVDASTINSLQSTLGSAWQGIAFGSQIGLWLHPVTGLTTTYSGAALTAFNYQSEGYYDGANTPTVPVPATASLIALGGLVAGRRRRA